MSSLFPWLYGLETEEDALFFASRVACHPLSNPRPCHFHPIPNPNILFDWEYSFPIKGIILLALGCEPTYIYITHKIPK